MTDTTETALSKRPRKSQIAMFVLALLPVVVCSTLYFYYLFAQDVINPMPVQGVLTEATCRHASISRQGVPTSIPSLRLVYVFPSRSLDHRQAGAAEPVMDEITDNIEYDHDAGCASVPISQELGSTRTIWAGENPRSDRFRARFHSERRYPPLALLWVPGLIAAIVVWGWRRATR